MSKKQLNTHQPARCYQPVSNHTKTPSSAMPPKVPPKKKPKIVVESSEPVAPIVDDFFVDDEPYAEAKIEALKNTSLARPLLFRNEELTLHHQAHLLGAGGCGAAYLWVAVDEKERVIERIVVKDCYMNTGSWRNMHEWHGDPHDPANRTHREIHFHRTLHGEDGSLEGGGREFLARMFHSETYPEEQAYRLYLQYYPHRSLQDVVDRYGDAQEDWEWMIEDAKEKAEAEAEAKKPKPQAKKGKATPKKSKAAAKKVEPLPQPRNRPIHVVGPESDDEEEPEEDKEEPDSQPPEPRVPEPFLWHILECLAHACQVLSNPSTSLEP